MHQLRKNTGGDRVFLTASYLLLFLFTLCCFLPFWIVVANSFARPRDLVKGFSLLPWPLTAETYQYLLFDTTILRNFRNSVIVTVGGTLLAVFVTTMYAYGLAHPKLRNRYIISFLTYIPMILGAGLVGFYLLIVKYLNLKDTYFAMILPYVFNPFNAFVMVSFLRTLPVDILEAAYIDGAGDIRIFFRIVWPLSIIPTVTVTLFYAVSYWNDWWLALLFVTKPALQPLQILIKDITARNEMASLLGSASSGAIQPVNVQLATVCLTIGPIILLYPFLQKYFIKGVLVGSVKG